MTDGRNPDRSVEERGDYLPSDPHAPDLSFGPTREGKSFELMNAALGSAPIEVPEGLIPPNRSQRRAMKRALRRRK